MQLLSEQRRVGGSGVWMMIKDLNMLVDGMNAQSSYPCRPCSALSVNRVIEYFMSADGLLRDIRLVDDRYATCAPQVYDLSMTPMKFVDATCLSGFPNR